MRPCIIYHTSIMIQYCTISYDCTKIYCIIRARYNVVSFYTVWYCIIWYCIVSYKNIALYHIIRDCSIIYNMILFNNIVSYQMIQYHIVSSDITLSDTMQYDIVHKTWYNILYQYNIVSYHTIWYYIIMQWYCTYDAMGIRIIWYMIYLQSHISSKFECCKTMQVWSLPCVSKTKLTVGQDSIFYSNIQTCFELQKVLHLFQHSDNEDQVQYIWSYPSL